VTTAELNSASQEATIPCSIDRSWSNQHKQILATLIVRKIAKPYAVLPSMIFNVKVIFKVTKPTSVKILFSIILHPLDHLCT